MLRRDRVRWGMTEAQAARRFRVSLHLYRELEAGTVYSGWEVYSAVVEQFGWPTSRTGARG